MTAAAPAWGWAEGRQAAQGMRRLRLQQGLTQPALGARMGSSKGRVSLYERSAARMSREAAEMAAAALGTDLAGLMAAGGAS
jgi:transcriptional regulator with XRE-family HTH domain